ncbi:MAG: histidine--tRNA ligase [Candidatus Aenigmatarchaeota archaeon]|nr:histidine--tRNA ligase [Candidatus Aenigmarchaeota archaeon]
MTEISRVKGTKDYILEEMEKINYIIEKVKETFERFGFRQMDTPALESWDILSKKGVGGSDILEETFRFKDKSNNEIGLRYDLTVPLARVIALNKNLPLPFKRYQIAKVWRYGDVSKGRLREFYQADIDIVGSSSLLADAEVLACASEALKRLHIDFLIRINSRRILFSMMKSARIEKEKMLEVIRAIDKLEKIGEDSVKDELKKIKIEEKSIDKIFDFIKMDFDSIALEGREEIENLIDYLDGFGIKNFKIDLSLARGLDYYTSVIFEIIAKKEGKLGSIAGGGRYDNLIELFAGKKIPATGISLGIDRIAEIIDRFPKKSLIYVALTSDKVLKKGFEIIKMLRDNGINVDFDLMKRKLAKQLEYANSLKIEFVIIVGEEDLKNNEVTLRNMVTGEEKKIKIENLIEELKQILSNKLI